MKLVSDNDMKRKENNPPAFRPAEVSRPEREFGELSKLLESVSFGLCVRFTPRTQPRARKKRERKKKRKRKSSTTGSGNDQDGRRLETFAQPRRSPYYTYASRDIDGDSTEPRPNVDTEICIAMVVLSEHS